MARNTDGNDTWKRTDQAVERVETLVKGGRTSLVGAIRHINELRSLERDFPDGEIIVGHCLNAIEAMLEGLHAEPVPASKDFVDQSRVLAADVLELGFEDDGSWDFNGILKLKHDARRLLTGVDEGEFTPDPGP